MNGDSFGPVNPDLDPVPGRPTTFGVDIPAELAAKCPRAVQALEVASFTLTLSTAPILANQDLDPSAALLWNLAVNDFRALVTESLDGEGRSATRSMRSLVEHAVNLSTVLDTPGAAAAYLEHLGRGSELMLQTMPGKDLLPRKERARYAQRIQRLHRKPARDFANIVKKRGSSFRRGWATDNLRQRATAHGMPDLYAFYQLGSLVSHGSAGGSMGVVRRTQGGRKTYRTGPALDLVPTALYGGLRAMETLVSRLDRAMDAYDLSDSLDQLAAALDLWPQLMAAVVDIDRRLWPDEAVDKPSAILAISTTGAMRWYLHLRAQAWIVEATEPVLPAGRLEQLKAVAEDIGTASLATGRYADRWVTVHIQDTVCMPKSGAVVIPQESILGHDLAPELATRLDKIFTRHGLGRLIRPESLPSVSRRVR